MAAVAQADHSNSRDVLPDTLKPVHYDLFLHDLELGGNWTYEGTLAIQLSIKQACKEVTLNAHLLKLHHAKISSLAGQSTIDSLGISYDEARQRVTITFPQAIPVGTAEINISFQGTMNADMAGFYRSKYQSAVTPSPAPQDESGNHYMFSTQFESCDARRALPCFDEPNLKATFDFAIEIPDQLVALSNMPEGEARHARPAKEGCKVVCFQRSPIMSTYLLAWAFGDFEYIESSTEKIYNGKQIPTRLYTTKGLKQKGQFALQHAGPLIDFYSEKFGIDYPLPKADLLAVHEFSSGAMENWGLVTYRTTSVLFDQETSDEKSKNYMAYVVAHELAHMWFGNLVTMDWWNDLWLNEGFATWVGWFATDHLHPDWNVWAQVCADHMQGAFGLDALRSSHPIEVHVSDALGVDQIFDAISYRKGMSVIRMLAAHLGVETFLKGVAIYLKAHAYGNATTDDLWASISEASGQDVNALMDPWIRKIGFPVLTVAEEPGQITIRQSRYLATGDATAEEDQVTWWVPLNLQGQAGVETSSLTTKETTIRGIDDEFYKFNSGTTGFYRVSYPPARLSKLGKQVDQLSLEDKIGVIRDAGALSLSGHARTPGLLSFIEGLHSETHFHVWSAILDTIATAKSIFEEDTDIYDGLKAFILKLVTPAAERIGWEYAENEDFLTVQLRSRLIRAASNNGHTGIIAEARRRFHAATHGPDPHAIHPNLRLAIYATAVREGGPAEYDAVKHLYHTTTAPDGRPICLQALGATRCPRLQQDYITFLFSPAVALQDLATGAATLGATAPRRRLLWSFLQTHFEPLITQRLGGNRALVDRLLRSGLSKFADEPVERDIGAFFAARPDNRGWDRGVEVVRDSIRARAGSRARDGEVVRAWLRAGGIAGGGEGAGASSSSL